MNDAALTLRQVEAEQKMFWRNPAGAFFGFAFPIVFLVIFGTINGGASVPVAGHADIPYNSYFVPSILVFGIIGACLTNIAISISIRRDAGILKRLRGSPLPPWAFLAGVLGSSLIVSAILVLLTAAFGHVVYSTPWPAHLLAGAVTLGTGALCFCAMGLAMTTIIPNGDAAPAVVNGIYLPVVFISGIFFPFHNDLLNNIASVFPVQHFKDAVFRAFDPARVFGGGWSGGDLLVVAAWGVASLIVAALRFRWEPARN